MVKLLMFISTLAGLAVPSLKGIEHKTAEVAKKEFTPIACLDNSPNEDLMQKMEPSVYWRSPKDEGLYEYQAEIISHIGDIESVWQTYRGDGVTIAYIDSGIYIDHVEFYNEFGRNVSTQSRSFFYEDNQLYYIPIGDDYEYASYLEPIEDSNGVNNHGVMTAAAGSGIINGYGMCGIAPESTILMVKTDFSIGAMNYGIKYAADCGAKVINISSGIFTTTKNTINEIQSAVDYAISKGSVVVASAGNNGDSKYFYPAACTGVVAVGALAYGSDDVADYSNSNPDNSKTKTNVDLVAPGTVFTATDYNAEESTSYYNYSQGTSMSAPLVAGACALFLEKNPNSTVEEVKEALLNSCDDIDSSGYDKKSGYGKLNVSKLLATTKPVTGKTIERDVTSIYWEDQINWNFRTLHLYDVQLAEGYTYADLEYYLSCEFGDPTNRDNWDMEGETSGWCFNSYGSSGDYLIRDGINNGYHEIILPDWVINADYQFVNNNHWYGNNDEDSSRLTVNDASDYYNTYLRSYIYNDNGNAKISTPFPEGVAKATFQAVTITYYLASKDGFINETKVETISVYDICLHEYWHYENCTFLGYYSDSSYTHELSPRHFENDTTVYGLYMAHPTMFFMQDQGWYQTYLYIEYVRDGVTYKPFGDAPGTPFNQVQGIQFEGSGLLSIELPLPDDGITSSDFLIYKKETSSSNVQGVVRISQDQMGPYHYLFATGQGYSLYTDDFTDGFGFLSYLLQKIYSVRAGDGILDYSVCGLADQADEILTVYNSIKERSLNGDAVASSAMISFNSLSFITYGKNDNSINEYITVNEVIAELQRIAINGSGSPYFGETFITGASSGVVIVSMLLIMGLMGPYFLKSKKTKEQ